MTIAGIAFWTVAIPLVLVVLVPLVLVHELGHFVVARLSGIRVLEFGIGFPPRAKVIGHDHETTYTLNYLPIGGFVLLEGEEADSDDPRGFGNATLPKQLIVLLGGVAMNVVTAVVLLFIVAWAFNPVVQPVILGAPVAGSPADLAGLKLGETLVSFDGQTQSLLAFSSDPAAAWRQDLIAHAGQTVTLVVADVNGVQRSVQVKLNVPTAKENWSLGIQFGSLAVVNTSGNPVSAAGLALDGTGRAMGLILQALGNIVGNLATHPTQAPSGVQGPVGIAADIGHVASQPNALMLLLLIAGIISANLALVNFLPFPPLDGGKMVIMVVKRVFGARGVSAVEAAAYVAGFAFLLAFIAWISYFDIIRGGAP